MVENLVCSYADTRELVPARLFNRKIGNTQSSVITSGSKRRRSPSEVWGMELFGPLARYDLKPFVSWRGADTQMQIAPRAVDLEVPPSEIAPAIFR